MGKEHILMQKLLRNYYQKILRERKNNSLLYWLFYIDTFNKEFKMLIFYNYISILLLNYINLFDYKFDFPKIIKNNYNKKVFNDSRYLLGSRKYLFNKRLLINVGDFIKKYDSKKKINFFFKQTLNNYFFTITILNYNVLITKSIGHFLKGSLNIKKRRKSKITLKLFIKFFKGFMIKHIKKWIFNKFFFTTHRYIIFRYIKWVVYTLLFSRVYVNEIIYLIKKAHNGTRKRKRRKL